MLEKVVYKIKIKFPGFNSNMSKIANPKFNLKRRIPYQMAKSKGQTYQTNGKQFIILYLVQAFLPIHNGGFNLLYSWLKFSLVLLSRITALY